MVLPTFSTQVSAVCVSSSACHWLCSVLGKGVPSFKYLSEVFISVICVLQWFLAGPALVSFLHLSPPHMDQLQPPLPPALKDLGLGQRSKGSRGQMVT